MARSPRWLWSKGAALLIFGFALNLVGLIGGALWLAPADDAVEAAAREVAAQSGKERILRGATNFHNTAEHLAGLVFLVPIPKDIANAMRAEMGELYRRSIDRGRYAFRAYLAEVALTRAADFQTTLNEYEALVAAERASFNADTYRATNAFEGDFETAMVNATGEAMLKPIPLLKERREAKVVAARRRLALTLTALAGAAIILAATLRGSAPAAPASGGAHTGGRDAKAATEGDSG